MRLLFAFLVTAALAFPQWVSFGIKTGVPISDTFKVARQPNLSYYSKTDRWTLGPMVELRLPFGIGIEANALYQPVNYQSETPTGTADTSGSAWRFPLIVKKRFGEGGAQPYIGAGPTFQHLYGLKEVRQFFLGGSSEGAPAELQNRNTIGGALVAGVEIKALFLKISPEIRYTRWGSESLRSTIGDGLRFNRNQAEFLVGFSF